MSRIAEKALLIAAIAITVFWLSFLGFALYVGRDHKVNCWDKQFIYKDFRECHDAAR